MIYYLFDYSKIFEVFKKINNIDEGCCIFIDNIDKLKNYYKKINYDKELIYPGPSDRELIYPDYDYLCYCDYDYLKQLDRDDNILFVCDVE